MVKRAYVELKNFRPDTKRLLGTIIAIVTEYQEQGYRMTLRQLYYQLVSRDVIPNKQKEYARLSSLLTDARMMGLIDWDFIEDRIRVPKIHADFADIPELIQAALASYRRDRWSDQNKYVEVWVEKDALSGVLAPVTDEYHVRLLVNRGYSSVTAMHDASKRFKYAENQGKECHLLYLGDHDPSGEDMVRDIRHRLDVFGCDVQVEKIALTMEQIQQYNPPPNPAKMSDSRAQAYVAEHGDESWELDALPPNVLDKLLRDNLNRHIDMEKYQAMIALEAKEKEKLEAIADGFDAAGDF